ncbi:MAG: TnpV protein [Clostridiales bacterium]|nr:TnpV protein [Clostridiales bacterium]
MARPTSRFFRGSQRIVVLLGLFHIPDAPSEQIQKFVEGTLHIRKCRPMEWVRRMNCIRQQAEEIVFKELIYS